MNVIKKIEEYNPLVGQFIVVVGGCVILGSQFEGRTGPLLGVIIGLALFGWMHKK